MVGLLVHQNIIETILVGLLQTVVFFKSFIFIYILNPDTNCGFFQCPHLGGLLSAVLPTCLLLVDDHEHSNKVIGLYCLQHVTTHVVSVI